MPLRLVVVLWLRVTDPRSGARLREAQHQLGKEPDRQGWFYQGRERDSRSCAAATMKD